MLTPGEPLVEVAVDSVAAAAAAAAAGADRLELCQSLDRGGLTPSRGLLDAIRARVSIPVFVLIRSRAGDFSYSPAEREVMERDVGAARDAGADGLVLGALDPTGAIDLAAVGALIARAGPLPVTFHRAFDRVAQPLEAIEQLLELGVSRVLTAGGAATAYAGRATIARTVARARGRLIVVAGGGVVGDQVVALVRETGVAEIHLAGCRTPAAGSGGGFGEASVPDIPRLNRVFEALRAARPA
jgi:copper homeostasis protein